MTAAVTGTETTFSVGRGNHRTWEILTAALSWFRAAESQKAWLHRGEKHINTACCAYCSAVLLMANLWSINLKNKTPVGHRKEEFVMLKNIFANCHMILSWLKKKCGKSNPKDATFKDLKISKGNLLCGGIWSHKQTNNYLTLQLINRQRNESAAIFIVIENSSSHQNFCFN